MIYFCGHALMNHIESYCRRIIFALVAGVALALWMPRALPGQTITTASRSVRAAGPWYVAPGGDDGNDCLFPATACATINGAIAKASSGDTILLATGTYTDTVSAVALLDKDVILSGGWSWDGSLAMQDGTSIIDGEGTRRGIVVGDGVSATVELCAVQNGSSFDRGGGVYNNGTLTLNRSVVRSNVADGEGGGIFNASGTITLNNSTVNDNTAGNAGGGIAGNRTLVLNNSTVSGNAAVVGGGIYVWHNGTTSVTVNSSTISGNVSDQGGGIHSGDSSPTVTVMLQNSILADNVSDLNNGPDCSGAIISLGYALLGNTSGCHLGQGIGDLINVDANLGPLTGLLGYHPLLSESPAINAGNPDGCVGSTGLLATDQRGFIRFGRCDIGAYEAQSFKTASAPTTLPGHQLTFTISAQNASAHVTDLCITDTLPLSLTYVEDSLTATSGSCGHKNRVISWTGTITVGQVVSITFGATVSPTIPLSTVIVNTAIVSGGGERVTRTATVNVDGQVCNFVKYADSPVLSQGTQGSWDERGVWDPAVLKEGEAYNMWYTGAAGSAPSQIGLAVSTDGVIWVKDSGNPVLSPSETWEARGIRAASVISGSGIFEMWYTGFDSSGTGQIGYATSPDGITWTKHGSSPVLDVGVPGSWEDSDVMHPTVIQIGGTYNMWYEGYDGITARVGHATSGDGVTWVRDPHNPVLDVGLPGDWDWLHVHSPGVVAYGGSYLLWYSGETLPPTLQTGYALSSNGRDWARKEMLIAEGSDGTFDTDGTDHPSAIVDGDRVQVWYTGIDHSGTYNVGYATATICDVSSASTLIIPLYLPIVMRDWWPWEPSCSPDYVDDFGDPSSGWPAYGDGDSEIAYTNGYYRIWLATPSLGRLVTPGAKATDFTVAVSARRASGDYGVYGIIFGINEDWSELYQVHVEANYYSIWRRDGETWFPLQYWTRSDHIHTGGDWNRLQVIRDGDDIALYVNDQHLTTVTDNSFTGLRRIGLVTYSPSGGSLDVHFDDFSLYPVDCGVETSGTGKGLFSWQP